MDSSPVETEENTEAVEFGDERAIRWARALRDAGRGILALLVVSVAVAMFAGVAWRDLPLVGVFGVAAVGLAALGTADLLEARAAGIRLRRVEAFERRYR